MHAMKRRNQIRTDPPTSQRLASQKRRDTVPELAIRSVVHGLGYRYRVSNRDLPGSPDLANRRRRWVVFVHGCFWHAHPGCERATVPKRNRAWWMEKFEANRARDRGKERQLRALGYRVIVIWECEIEGGEELVSRIRRELGRSHS